MPGSPETASICDDFENGARSPVTAAAARVTNMCSPFYPESEMTDTNTTNTEPQAAAKSVAEHVSELAERAVTVPLGAGLVVRDDLTSAFRKLHRKYGTTAGLEKELSRYEKRGTRARNRFEKQVRSQRTKFERGVRQHRKDFEKHSGAVASRVEEIFSAAQGLIS